MATPCRNRASWFATLAILTLFGQVGEPVLAVTVTAGHEPIADVGNPDGWRNILYVNEQRPFDFASHGAASATSSRR